MRVCAGPIHPRRKPRAVNPCLSGGAVPRLTSTEGRGKSVIVIHVKMTMDLPGRLAVTVKRSFPILPPNAEIPTLQKHLGPVARVFLLLMHACGDLSRLNPSQRTKELYIYKTLHLQELVNDRCQLCAECAPVLLVVNPLMN